jgi:hypothetical protein
VGDDIGKFVSDIMSPWLGSKPATPPQVVRGKEVVKTLVRQADLVTGGYGRAAMAGPSELAKQAAINLAVGGAGYGVGRAAQAALMSGRVVNPVAAVRNLVKGERVIVHGTAEKLRGNVLKGVAGEVDDDTRVVFGWNPSKPQSRLFVPARARSFATGTIYGRPDLQSAQRNVVVARVKKADTYPHHGGLENEATITAGDARIVSVVKAPPVGAPQSALDAYSKQLAREVAKAGSRLRGRDRLGELRLAVETARFRRGRR